MCVICYKPKGLAKPSKGLLNAMHLINRDGCGFVSTKSSYKGTDYKAFLKALKGVGDDEELVIHFRYATTGSVCDSNCHPFYDRETGVWFAHNGVLDVDAIGDLTDSETYFKYDLAPTIAEYGLNSDETRYNIRGVIGGSRFALYDPSTDAVSLYGRWCQFAGMWFSNLNFAHFYDGGGNRFAI